MPGGRLARIGFRFQDLAALWLWLGDHVASFWSQTGSDDVMDVGVEAQHGQRSPIWDIFLLRQSGLRLVYEAKSGELEKSDKTRTFWHRVRREASSDLSLLRIGWILTPSGGAGFARKLEQLRREIGSIKPDSVPSEEPTEDIRTWGDLSKHALYWLCQAPDSKASGAPAVEFQQAQRLIESMEVELVTKDSLASRIEGYLGCLMPDADPYPLLHQLRGELQGAAERLNGTGRLACKDLLMRLEGLFGSDEAKKAAKMLRGYVDLSERIEQGDISGEVPLQELDSIPESDHQALLAADPGLTVILGHAGVGKTVMAKLVYRSMAEETQQAFPQSVFISGSSLESEEVEVLDFAIKMLSVNGVPRLVVDALEEAPSSHLEKLSRKLRYLSDLQTARIVVTCRDELWRCEPTLAPLRDRPSNRILKLAEWDDQRLGIALESAIEMSLEQLDDPLRDVLRTPFFLDVFVQLVKSSPNDRSSAVTSATRLDLLCKYRESRIESSRYPSEHHENGVPAKRTALQVLVQRCLTGEEFFQRDIHPGVEGLLRAGVLVYGSESGMVRFRHRLLRDYLVAGDLLGTALVADGENEVWSQLEKHRDTLSRDAIMEMFLSLLFDCSEKAKLGAQWIRLGEQKVRDSSDPQGLYFSSLAAWSRLDPAAQRFVSPHEWPSNAPPPEIETLGRLIRYVKAHLRTETAPLAKRWWDHAISHWTIEPGPNALRHLTDAALLAAALFEKDHDQSRKHPVGLILLNWSQVIASKDFDTWEHYRIIGITADLLQEIPVDWLIRHTECQSGLVRPKFPPDFSWFSCLSCGRSRL